MRAVATAPVRVADVGGWTDTWFAERGAVCSIAVGPGASAEVVVRNGRGDGEPSVRLWAPDLGVSSWVGPSVDGWSRPEPGVQPLLEHTVGEVAGRLPAGTVGPDGIGLDVTVSAAVPPGSSLGTSASVLVALLAALEAVTSAGQPDPSALAARAHAIEVERAGRESGVQDHWAAAWGGVSWIEVDPFPHVQRREVVLPAATTAALAARLVTVHLGGGHDSSVLHRVVIDAAEAGDGGVLDVLRELRALAALAARRLEAGDLDGWGAVLTAATQEQTRLHPALVGDAARAVTDLAALHGVGGWKVNGAGGAGGTVTLLAPADPVRADALRAALVDARWTLLDLQPAAGVSVDAIRPT